MKNSPCRTRSINYAHIIFNQGALGAIFFFFMSGGLRAQDAIVTAGGEANGSNGAISYTIGQVGYTTHTGINGSMSVGVQQSYQVATILGAEFTNIDLNLSIYPNPTTDVLNLRIGNNENENMSYQLYNMKGVVFVDKKLINGDHAISMSGLPESTYFLSVAIERTIVKTFKIIKN